MATKQPRMPEGWVLTVQVEPTDDEPGDYRAFKFIEGRGTVDQHTQSMETLVDACNDYNQFTAGLETAVAVEGE